MLAILKREFRSFFTTVTGYIYVAVNLLFLGIYFYAYHLYMGNPYIAYTIQSSLFVFLIITPILTMRSMSEEKKQKTDQLLFTAPVSPIKIVMGKYLGMIAVFMIPTVVVAIYPLFLGMFGKVPMGESYVAVLAYFLFGATCISIGLFISSLTENVIISAVLSFAVLLLCYLSSGIRNVISSTGNIFTKIMKIIDISTPMDDLMGGILNLKSVLYFLSVIFIMILFTCERIIRQRYELNIHTIKKLLFSSITTIVLIGVFLGLNIGIRFVPAAYVSIDMTADKMYEIDESTKILVSNLTQKVTIYVIYSQDGYDSSVAKTLEEYKALSANINVEYKDPDVSSEFGTNYNIENPEEGSLIVVSDKRSKYIPYSQLYLTEFNYETYSQDTTGYDAQGQITSAIDFVTTDDIPVVYNIVGHGEMELGSNLKSLISKANIDIEELSLIQRDSIPEDAQAIIINAPAVDFSADDAKKVSEFLAAGKSALIVTGYTDSKLTNFDTIVEEYGISLAEGMVMEESMDNYYQTPVYLLPNLEPSTITASLSSKKRYVFLPYAKGAVFVPRDNSGDTVEKLLTTSGTAFSKVDVKNAQSFDKEEGDIEGPFTLGLYLESPVGVDTTIRLLYFTSSEMLGDTADQMVGYANSELVMNGLSTMVKQKESSVSIPAKTFSRDSLMVSRGKAVFTGIIVAIFIPLMCFVIGIMVWAIRRKR